MNIYKDNNNNQTIWRYKYDYLNDQLDDVIKNCEFYGTKDDFEEYKSCEELTYGGSFRNVKKTHANYLEYRTWFWTICQGTKND